MNHILGYKYTPCRNNWVEVIRIRNTVFFESIVYLGMILFNSSSL
jgi:hypothetical protein